MRINSFYLFFSKKSGTIGLSDKPLYQVELYSKENTMQLKLEPEFLKMYQHLIKWAKGGKVSVLDVGCGTGCTTIKVLKPFLPENFQELVGLDSCSEMIEFSKRNYKEDKMEFLVQDITKDLLLELRGRFHHIFSFFCLQVVPEQK